MVHGTFGSWFIMVHGSSTSEATESSAWLRVNGSRLIKQKPGKPLQWALRSCRAFMPSVTSLSFKASFTAKGMTLVIPPGWLKPTEGKTEKTDEDWGIAAAKCERYRYVF